MLVVSVVIFCLVGLGLIGMGYRFISADPPVDYHDEILSSTAVTDEVKQVLGALYKGMGGTFVALGLGTILIAVSGVWNDLFMAKLTLLVMCCVTAAFTATAARTLEQQSSVRTPWRIAAGLVGTSVLAFVLSLL
ncbi:hypothetical protein N9W17_01400 [Jannaschia sp.]|nr:hypothetical protein [Jannaschia sp.]